MVENFWGTSENAVRIQVYVAICTYCLVSIIQHDMKLEKSMYDILTVLKPSLLDRMRLDDLLGEMPERDGETDSDGLELDFLSNAGFLMDR